jgi:hypothetical protein
MLNSPNASLSAAAKAKRRCAARAFDIARATARPALRFEGCLRRSLDPSRLTLPNFFCLGAPQCGTTWLWDNLVKHPDVSVPLKEPHYFDRFSHRPLGWYTRLYRKTHVASVGDMSTSYIHLKPRQIKLLSALVPTARLIVIVRNPTQRTWSAYRRWQQGIRHPSVRDLADYLEWSVDVHRHWALIPVDYSFYSVALTNWIHFFPADRLLTLSLDDIVSSPQQVMFRVLNHLELEPAYYPWHELTSTPINSNPRIDMPNDVRRALDLRYMNEHARLSSLLGIGSLWK